MFHIVLRDESGSEELSFTVHPGDLYFYEKTGRGKRGSYKDESFEALYNIADFVARRRGLWNGKNADELAETYPVMEVVEEEEPDPTHPDR